MLPWNCIGPYLISAAGTACFVAALAEVALAAEEFQASIDNGSREALCHLAQQLRGVGSLRLDLAAELK
jgi:hypothetical protein